MPPLLSKSKYLTGLQCPKYLWTLVSQPETIPEPDTVTQYIFDQGHLVGEMAKKLFPSGIDIPRDDFMENIAATKKLLAKKKAIVRGRNPLRENLLQSRHIEPGQRG